MVDILYCKLFYELLICNFKINYNFFIIIDFFSLKMIYYFGRLKVNMYGLVLILLII